MSRTHHARRHRCRWEVVSTRTRWVVTRGMGRHRRLQSQRCRECGQTREVKVN